MSSIIKKVLKISLIAYLIYIFIFSIFVFNFHRSSSKKAETNELTNAHPQGDNPRVALIESSEEAVSARVSLIENAETHIDFAYYKWADGKVSDMMLGSVLEAADRGVKVRFLLDGMIQLGNIGTKVNDVFLGFSAHPNIEIKLYEPLNLFNPLGWNNRLHDKIIIVDGELALIGGRNIEDRFYLRDVHGDPFVKDREVLLYQPEMATASEPFTGVLEQIGDYYDTLWAHRYVKPKHRYMSKRRIRKGDEALVKIREQHEVFKVEYLGTYYKGVKDIDWEARTLPTNGVHFVANTIGRFNQDPNCLKAILQLSEEAEETIFIQSPYIIPSRSIDRLFQQYAIDPAKITLLTNSKASSPNVMAFSAYKHHKQDIIDDGIRVFEYQSPGSIHGKTAQFDNRFSVVGTFNIDPRSSYINTESMVIIDSKPFSATLTSELKQELDFTLEVDEDYDYILTDDFTPGQIPRMKERLISLLSRFTPLIEYLL